jgi:hypothetical protein
MKWSKKKDEQAIIGDWGWPGGWMGEKTTPKLLVGPCVRWWAELDDNELIRKLG